MEFVFKVLFMKRLAFVIILFISLSSYGFDKTGSSAAQFLKIGVGTRATAMAGSFVALANDVSSLYWNPAGIVGVQSTALMGSHMMLFAGISHEFVGFVMPFAQGSVGFGAIFLNSGEMEITTPRKPNGTGITFSYGCASVGLSYARYLTDRFCTGLTLKYIQERAWNETSSTFAFDIGSQLETDILGMRVGMCMSNFGGGMRLEGRDLLTTGDIAPDISGNPDVSAVLETSSWNLPLHFRVGTALDIIGEKSQIVKSDIHRITLLVDANHSNDNREWVSSGLEYEFVGISLRSGYRFSGDEEGLSLGGSICMGGGKFEVGYALTDFGRLGGVHRFSLEMKW